MSILVPGYTSAADPQAPPPSRPYPMPNLPGPNSLEAVERNHILAILQKNHGNRAASAEELGISLRKLYYRLGQYQREGFLH